MKKIILSAIMAAAVFGCQSISDDVTPIAQEGTFTASMEQFEQHTKTSMTELRNVVWSTGDRIAIFQGSSLADTYQVTDASVGKSNGTFKIVTDNSSGINGDFSSGVELSANIAFYPYTDGLLCVNAAVTDSETGSEVTAYSIEGAVLPSVQNYSANSFGDETFPMVAVTRSISGHNLNFKNVCGAIKLQLKGTQTIKSIVIEGKNNEKLSGAATVTAYPSGLAPAITMSADASTSVTLDCGEGVQLTEGTATDFIIALPPVLFSKGFTVTVVDSDGNSSTIETEKENTVIRSSLLVMPEVTLEASESENPAGDSVNLSQSGNANCYIISQNGAYRFKTVKGNSSESVGSVSSAEVLWETFGTDVTPNMGDLVKNAGYSDGYITFQTAETFKEGNAVIAAKDASGNIIWSWHIWLTDQPQGQEYYNNAGTMMDRNLGATSAIPGDVGALGLLYQWGRKDPFLGSSSICESVEAKSTISWPSTVSSDSSNGTIEYATAHPTTFITQNSNNADWYYTGSISTDYTRWTTSESSKSIYDPCPAGWRVPDGGSNGVWSTARGSSYVFNASILYDSPNKGTNFSGEFGSASTIWYPASGCRDSYNDGINYVGDYGLYWSASPADYRAYYLFLEFVGEVDPSSCNPNVSAYSVRCVREGTSSSTPSEQAVNLSQSGTANSYVVSSAGSYKFSTVKGNSSESVGSVSSAEVLWETFGTYVAPSVGDLVKNVSYSDGYIVFQTADTFKEGNAVIAAKDASGTILWSWHIWFTDQPQAQVYNNDAGTMMDRNLGATSATKGDVGALGLLYQWGRKDPFLGSSSISDNIVAKSTITWPSAVESNSSNGTIEYATAHPTTFITYNSKNYDWYYTGSSATDNTRWTTSSNDKSIYDPCPAGWRVPDGGSNGIWSKAGFDDTTYDSTNEGISFSISSPSTTWYPASGYRSLIDGSLNNVGNYGLYWSASPDSYYAYSLRFKYNGDVNPSSSNRRAIRYSVRCLQE